MLAHVCGAGLSVLDEGGSFGDMAWWVTARADDTLFRVMASSLTAEERLGISANWP